MLCALGRRGSVIVAIFAVLVWKAFSFGMLVWFDKELTGRAVVVAGQLGL